MDPATALSVAGNVLQLIGIASQIFSKGYRLYNSTDGVLPEHSHRITLVQDLAQVNQRVTACLLQSTVSSSFTDDEKLCTQSASSAIALATNFYPSSDDLQ